MVTIESLRVDHFARLTVQAAQQAYVTPLLGDPDYVTGLIAAGPAGAAVDRYGVTLAAAGLMSPWPGRAVAWSILSDQARGHMLVLTRAVLRGLETCGFGRVETVVKTDFDAGHRWARMLGFAAEGDMPGYAPDGSTHTLYGRYRPVSAAALLGG